MRSYEPVNLTIGHRLCLMQAQCDFVPDPKPRSLDTRSSNGSLQLLAKYRFDFLYCFVGLSLTLLAKARMPESNGPLSTTWTATRTLHTAADIRERWNMQLSTASCILRTCATA